MFVAGYQTPLTRRQSACVAYMYAGEALGT
jgi:hypothetical protein